MWAVRRPRATEIAGERFKFQQLLLYRVEFRAINLNFRSRERASILYPSGRLNVVLSNACYYFGRRKKKKVQCNL